jgi:glutamate---cysteine ligase / carboxylate-amine ligase
MIGGFKFGIEEEYFLTDAQSRDAARTRLEAFFSACRGHFSGDNVQREMLQPQVEVTTPPCDDFADARRTLATLRSALSTVAREHDLGIVAAGTHPLAVWKGRRATRQPRYGKLMHDLQMLGSRNMVCGLHVHVEISDLAARVDLMNRSLPFTPLLLALSTSSPFWQAQRTGLHGYRLAAYRELPRTGLPELFEDAADYDLYIETLVAAGAIEDSSFVWWVIRPSRKHPTLELRVADSCTRLDDALAIAALFRCLVRHLSRDRGLNAALTATSRAIIGENCWRAQRYGIHGSFVDEASRAAKPVAEVLEHALALVAEDAAALGCTAQVEATRNILTRGTSADRQLALYADARARGLSNREALACVVDWLTTETAGESRMMHQANACQRVALPATSPCAFDVGRTATRPAHQLAS